MLLARKKHKKPNFCLESYNKNLVAASYSLRKLKSNVFSPVTVVDDTLTAADWNFSGENFDYGRLLRWLGRDLLVSIPLGTDGDTNGISDGWTHTNGSGITSTPTIDSSAQKIEITASSSTNYASIYKEVSCDVGNSFTVNCTVKTTGNVKAVIQILWYTAAPAFISTSATTATAYADFTAVQLTANAPANAKYADIYLSILPNSNGDVGSGWFKLADASISNQSCYVSKQVDQSGNGLHVVQTTHAKRPRLVNAGVLDVSGTNNRPTVKYLGTASPNNQVLTLTPVPSGTSLDITTYPFYLNCVFNSSVGATTAYLFAKNSSGSGDLQYALQYDGSNTRISTFIENSSRQNTANASFPTGTQHIASCTIISGSQQGYKNGAVSSSAGTYSGAITAGRTHLNIGARANNPGNTAWSLVYVGDIAEMIILGGGISVSPSTRLNTERSQGKFFGIATP